MNGKGDAPRPVNLKVYRENFDAINWRKHITAGELEKRFDKGEDVLEYFAVDNAGIKPSHLDFMRSMGFACKDEQDAYELRGLLDM